MGKGPQFEREFSKQLSLWWSDGEEDDLFWRSSASGARATTRAKTRQRTHGQYGDICATHPGAVPFTDAFTIELKRGYASQNFMDLIDRPETINQTQWEEWIQKAHTNSILSESLVGWLLVIRRDKRRPIVVMPRAALETLLKYNRGMKSFCPLAYFVCRVRFYETTITRKGKRKSKKKHLVDTQTMKLVAVAWDDFIGKVDPDEIRRMVRCIKKTR